MAKHSLDFVCYCLLRLVSLDPHLKRLHRSLGTLVEELSLYDERGLGDAHRCLASASRPLVAERTQRDARDAWNGHDAAEDMACLSRWNVFQAPESWFPKSSRVTCHRTRPEHRPRAAGLRTFGAKSAPWPGPTRFCDLATRPIHPLTASEWEASSSSAFKTLVTALGDIGRGYGLVDFPVASMQLLDDSWEEEPGYDNVVAFRITACGSNGVHDLLAFEWFLCPLPRLDDSPTPLRAQTDSIGSWLPLAGFPRLRPRRTSATYFEGDSDRKRRSLGRGGEHGRRPSPCRSTLATC